MGLIEDIDSKIVPNAKKRSINECISSREALFKELKD